MNGKCLFRIEKSQNKALIVRTSRNELKQAYKLKTVVRLNHLGDTTEGGREADIVLLQSCTQEYLSMFTSLPPTRDLGLHVLFLFRLCFSLGSGGCLCTSSGKRPCCWTGVASATFLLFSEGHGWVTPTFSGYHRESELVMSLGDLWVAGLKRSCGDLLFSC